MILKCGLIENNKFFGKMLAELFYITIEIKIHSLQINANDYNGINNLRFRKVIAIFCVFL